MPLEEGRGRAGAVVDELLAQREEAGGRVEEVRQAAGQALRVVRLLLPRQAQARTRTPLRDWEARDWDWREERRGSKLTWQKRVCSARLSQLSVMWLRMVCPSRPTFFSRRTRSKNPLPTSRPRRCSEMAGFLRYHTLQQPPHHRLVSSDMGTGRSDVLVLDLMMVSMMMLVMMIIMVMVMAMTTMRRRRRRGRRGGAERRGRRHCLR